MKPPFSKPGHALLQQLFADETRGEIPLDQAACAIALPHRPDLSVGLICNCLDRLAEEALNNISGSEDSSDKLDSVRETLFSSHAFRGNEEKYYAPENSFIDVVLEKEVGIPITLSLVFIEVARRVGVPVFGLSLPCHFMVGGYQEGHLRIFDPFHAGVERSMEETVELIHILSGGAVTIGRDHFKPASTRTILFRMLTNLRGIYRRLNEPERLIPVLEQTLILDASDPSVHGELALHLANTGDLSSAHSHLKQYISLVGELSDEEKSSEWVQRIRTEFSVYN